MERFDDIYLEDEFEDEYDNEEYDDEYAEDGEYVEGEEPAEE